MTQSDVEYIFRTERGQVLYKGHDLHRLVMVVLSRIGFTEDQGIDIGDHIFYTWKYAVQTSDAIEQRSHSWRAVDYRDDYEKGQSWFHRGRSLVFQLAGARANAVEHGWAPPNSTEWAAGIGTYDGEYKDLRPWLLYSGHPSVKTLGPKKGKKSNFNLYRYLKFDTPTLGTMLETTAQHQLAEENAKQLAETQTQMNDEDRERFMQRQKQVLQHTARSSLQRDEAGNLVFKPLDLNAVTPAKDAYGQHQNWIYHSATMQGAIPFKTTRAAMHYAMHKAKFTVFRTITDSQDQIERKLFFSKGIKPAKLLLGENSVVVAAAKEAIMNVMSGKNADGSERNGR